MKESIGTSDQVFIHVEKVKAPEQDKDENGQPEGIQDENDNSIEPGEPEA